MNSAALKSDTQDIVVDEILPHAPETIWKTLTTGELIGRWIMPATGFEPVKGKHFPFRTTAAEAKHWDIVGDSGNVKTRAFCPACGSPVYLTFAARPELFTIHAASLDDPHRYKPQMVIYGVRGYAWDHVGAALPKFDRMLPSG